MRKLTDKVRQALDLVSDMAQMIENDDEINSFFWEAYPEEMSKDDFFGAALRYINRAYDFKA